MAKITKEAALAAMIRFVREFGRYPTKHDYKNVGYLFSPETSRRLLGGLRSLTVLQDVYLENPKYCPECKSIIPFDKREVNTFCNQSCSAKFHNRDKRKPADKKFRYYAAPRELFCLNCEISLLELNNKSTKYCSLQCQQDYKTQERLSEWQKGKHFSNRVIRRFLEILDGYKCSVCGLSEWNDRPITLEVEHKDGNSEDSSPSNVCLICPNCHSQTDTYKGKNKGNGRHWRRQRYQDGKSY
jgi:hypothetical protein